MYNGRMKGRKTGCSKLRGCGIGVNTVKRKTVPSARAAAPVRGALSVTKEGAKEFFNVSEIRECLNGHQATHGLIVKEILTGLSFRELTTSVYVYKSVTN